MFLGAKYNEIFRTVVISHHVNMMDNFPLLKKTSKFLFCYKSMFLNIPMNCKRMLGLVYFHVPMRIFSSSTLPRHTSFTSKPYSIRFRDNISDFFCVSLTKKWIINSRKEVFRTTRMRTVFSSLKPRFVFTNNFFVALFTYNHIYL